MGGHGELGLAPPSDTISLCLWHYPQNMGTLEPSDQPLAAWQLTEQADSSSSNGSAKVARPHQCSGPRSVNCSVAAGLVFYDPGRREAAHAQQSLALLFFLQLVWTLLPFMVRLE